MNKKKKFEKQAKNQTKKKFKTKKTQNKKCNFLYSENWREMFE